jgi:hypothetical protein
MQQLYSSKSKCKDRYSSFSLGLTGSGFKVQGQIPIVNFTGNLPDILSAINLSYALILIQYVSHRAPVEIQQVDTNELNVLIMYYL